MRHDSNGALFCAFNAGFQDVLIDIPPGYSHGKLLMDTRLQDGKLVIPALGCAFVEI